VSFQRKVDHELGYATAGPLIVEEYEGTTVVPPNCAARLDQAGNIVIEVGRTA